MTACGRIPLPNPGPAAVSARQTPEPLRQQEPLRRHRATVRMRGRDLDLLAIALTCDPKPTSLMLVALARCVADARGAGY